MTVTFSDTSDLYTELSTNWNTAVIALPKIKEIDVQVYNQNYPDRFSAPIDAFPMILLLWDYFELKRGTIGVRPADILTNHFLIKLVAQTKADINNVFSEVRRILNAKSLDGRWHVNRCTPAKNDKFKTYIVNMDETLFYP